MPEFQFSTASAMEVDADLLVLPMFEGPEAGPGVKEVDAALDADLAEICRDNRMRGKLGEAFTVPTLGKIRAKGVLLVGLGRRDQANSDTIRRALGRVAARAARFETVATTVAQAAGRRAEEAAEAAVEGLLLGSYRFARDKAADGGNRDGRASPGPASLLSPLRRGRR